MADVDVLLEQLKATLPAGVANFMDVCKTVLWPQAEKAAREMGLTPMEQRECAIRVVRAAVQQMASTYKRAKMRDNARNGSLIRPV